MMQPKKKKVCGKRKGNQYEIIVARLLTKWFDPTAEMDLFWRSASSGAVATMARKAGKESNQHGDIKATADTSMVITDKLFIECKSYRDIDLFPVICTDKKSIILGWWEKLLYESGVAHKIPVLIFKKNGSTNFIMIQDTFVSKLIGYGSSLLLSGFIRFDVCVDGGLMGVSIYRLDDFLKAVDPENMILLLEEYHSPVSTILARAATLEW